MRLQKRLMTTVLTLSSIILMLGACTDSGKANSTGGAGAGKQITLQFIRVGAAEIVNPIFDPMIKEFEKQNPGVKVEQMNLGFQDAASKLPLMASSGMLPDVLYVTMDRGFDLALKDKLLPLDSYLDKDAKLKNDIAPSLWDGIEFQKKHYWVPAGVATIQLWYNTELYKKAGLDPNAPPKTLDEFVAAAQQITAKTGVPGLGMYAATGEDLASLFQSVYSSMSGKPLWDKAKADFTYRLPENKQYAGQAMQFLSDLNSKYKVTQSNVVEFSRDSVRPLFRDGKVAMTLDGIWIKARIQEQIDKGTLKPALFPAGSSGSHPLMGVDGWGIPKNSKNPDAAWKLIQYLMSTPNQSRHDNTYGLNPVLNSESQMPLYQTDFWKPMIESVKTSYARIANPSIASLEKLTAENVQSVILGKSTAAEGVENILKGSSALMSK